MSQVPKGRPSYGGQVPTPTSQMASDEVRSQSQNSGSTTQLSKISGPLPDGWDMGIDFDGKAYFIDHKNNVNVILIPEKLTKLQRKF